MDVISVEDEKIMCEKNILGSSMPKQLVDTILYLFGVHFAMCAGLEYCSLCIGPKKHCVMKVVSDTYSTMKMPVKLSRGVLITARLNQRRCMLMKFWPTPINA